jgi:hypothetical protein
VKINGLSEIVGLPRWKGLVAEAAVDFPQTGGHSDGLSFRLNPWITARESLL